MHEGAYVARRKRRKGFRGGRTIQYRRAQPNLAPSRDFYPLPKISGAEKPRTRTLVTTPKRTVHDMIGVYVKKVVYIRTPKRDVARKKQKRSVFTWAPKAE